MYRQRESSRMRFKTCFVAILVLVIVFVIITIKLNFHQMDQLDGPLQTPPIGAAITMFPILDRGAVKPYDEADFSDTVQVLGSPEPGVKYATFGCQLPHDLPRNAWRSQFTFAFYLPLTVRAWRRIGFGCVVYFSGSESDWRANDLLTYIVDEVRRQGAVVLFLKVPEVTEVLISQVGRLFIANLLPWQHMEDTYLLTTDADLWPIRSDMYAPTRADAKLYHLNTERGEHFNFKNKTYKMLHLSNHGMTVARWRDVMQLDTRRVATPRDIIRYLHEDFGYVAHQPVQKGHFSWYLDLYTISRRVEEWAQQNGHHFVEYTHRVPHNRDRLSRNGKWEVPETLEGLVDVHLPLKGFDRWEYLEPLLVKMYDAQEYDECVDYHAEFVKRMNKIQQKIKLEP